MSHQNSGIIQITKFLFICSVYVNYIHDVLVSTFLLAFLEKLSKLIGFIWCYWIWVILTFLWIDLWLEKLNLRSFFFWEGVQVIGCEFVSLGRYRMFSGFRFKNWFVLLHSTFLRLSKVWWWGLIKHNFIFNFYF